MSCCLSSQATSCNFTWRQSTTVLPFLVGSKENIFIIISTPTHKLITHTVIKTYQRCTCSATHRHTVDTPFMLQVVFSRTTCRLQHTHRPQQQGAYIDWYWLVYLRHNLYITWGRDRDGILVWSILWRSFYSVSLCCFWPPACIAVVGLQHTSLSIGRLTHISHRNMLIHLCTSIYVCVYAYLSRH